MSKLLDHLMALVIGLGFVLFVVFLVLAFLGAGILLIMLGTYNFWFLVVVIVLVVAYLMGRDYQVNG